ncbi:tetratricopeptide repeat protein [Ferruginibacter sp.]
MKYITTLLLLLPLLFAKAQQPTAEESFYSLVSYNPGNEASVANAEKKLRTYLNENPAGNYRSAAFYFLADILKQHNKPDSAIQLYERSLQLPLADSMSALYFKNQAAIHIAEIYIARNDFCTAINYIDLAKYTFVPRYQCGNARAEAFIQQQRLYAACYAGLGDYTRAIDTLMPPLFNPFAATTELSGQLYNTWLHLYTPRQIKEQFVQAEQNILIKKEKYYNFEYLKPVIKIFGKEVLLNVYDLNNKTPQQQTAACLEHLKKAYIYKLVMKN